MYDVFDCDTIRGVLASVTLFSPCELRGCLLPALSLEGEGMAAE
jgi:hypothetical protein